MSRRHAVKSYKMFDNTDISAADQTSDVVNVLQLDKATIKLTWSGDAVGVVTIQATNVDQDKTVESDWYDLPLLNTIDIDGAQGFLHQILMNAMPFNAIRLKFTRTSGTTGAMDATITLISTGA